MPKSRTVPCPTCNGTGVVQGRYTEPELACTRCGGEGIIPSDEKTAADVVDEVQGKDGEDNG